MKLHSTTGIGALAATLAVVGVAGVGFAPTTAPTDLPTVTVHHNPT